MQYPGLSQMEVDKECYKQKANMIGDFYRRSSTSSFDKLQSVNNQRLIFKAEASKECTLNIQLPLKRKEKKRVHTEYQMHPKTFWVMEHGEYRIKNQ